MTPDQAADKAAALRNKGIITPSHVSHPPKVHKPLTFGGVVGAVLVAQVIWAIGGPVAFALMVMLTGGM
jgi:hypothetical protein